MYRLNSDFEAALLLEKFVLQMSQVRNTQNETKHTSFEEKAISSTKTKNLV